MDCEENRNRVLIEMRGVSVNRAEGCGLHNTNWTISRGEHWGILGDSGSGKSLLIDALTRRVPLSAGAINYSFDPNEIASFSAADCRRFLAGRLPYIQARWESSVQMNAALARDLLNRDLDKQLLETLQLDKVLDRPLISLSSGEFRKFMLARALMAAPRLLVLEDPLSGLDWESEAEFRKFLESLCEKPSPVLVTVVSQPEHLLKGLSHVMVVENHRIVRMGPGSAGVPPAVPAPPARSIVSAIEARKMPAAPRQARSLRSQAGHPHPRSDPIIEMRDVSVQYGNARILEAINWTVREGENWAILGPNGAGKSTLLSLVTADNPQAYVNDIRLFGRQRGTGESIWDIRRQIGAVSPELQLCYPAEATALEVVCSGLFDSIGLYRTCSPEQEGKARGWLEKLGTHDLSARAFWSLSAAEQRLVLLARALIKQPRLLVLDEPCLGLDASHVTRFLGRLEELSRTQATTVLYVTHRPEELPRTISHVLKLERARMVSAGPALTAKCGTII